MVECVSCFISRPSHFHPKKCIRSTRGSKRLSGREGAIEIEGERGRGWVGEEVRQVQASHGCRLPLHAGPFERYSISEGGLLKLTLPTVFHSSMFEKRLQERANGSKNECGVCSGSEAGSYLRPTDFLYHSTLGLRVIKRKKNPERALRGAGAQRESSLLTTYWSESTLSS